MFNLLYKTSMFFLKILVPLFIFFILPLYLFREAIIEFMIESIPVKESDIEVETKINIESESMIGPVILAFREENIIYILGENFNANLSITRDTPLIEFLFEELKLNPQQVEKLNLDKLEKPFIGNIRYFYQNNKELSFEVVDGIVKQEET